MVRRVWNGCREGRLIQRLRVRLHPFYLRLVNYPDLEAVEDPISEGGRRSLCQSELDLVANAMPRRLCSCVRAHRRGGWKRPNSRASTYAFFSIWCASFFLRIRRDDLWLSSVYAYIHPGRRGKKSSPSLSSLPPPRRRCSSIP